MKNHIYRKGVVILIILIFSMGFSQTIESFENNNDNKKTGLFDPSRLSINHSVSFGMSSSSNQSGIKSQSLYSTMMTYKFSKPITLNLNFSLPIHSTYYSKHNLTPDNVESLEYFKNMPIDASVLWQPTEKFSMKLSIQRNIYADYFARPFSSYYDGPFSNTEW
ncbi:MAG: hypothetical protein PVI26_04410 [Chitinispirillia bacterium]|jgi:hypothetical protein